MTDTVVEQAVTLNYVKAGGAAHRRFPSTVIAQDCYGIWTLRGAADEVTWADGTKGTFPSPGVTLLPRQREDWWTIIYPVPDRTAELGNLYGNIGYQQSVRPDEIVLVDLELDVVFCDGNFVVIDIDEFQAAAPAYPAQVVEKARREADRLTEWLRHAADSLCATINRHL